MIKWPRKKENANYSSVPHIIMFVDKRELEIKLEAFLAREFKFSVLLILIASFEQ